MGNHHSSAPGLHRASSSTHRDVVERLGLSAITSGLSLDDTEKIWNTYHTNDTTFIDFQEWTALAKDLIKTAMHELEAKNVAEFKLMIARRRLHPLESSKVVSPIQSSPNGTVQSKFRSASTVEQMSPRLAQLQQDAQVRRTSAGIVSLSQSLNVSAPISPNNVTSLSILSASTNNVAKSPVSSDLSNSHIPSSLPVLPPGDVHHIKDLLSASSSVNQPLSEPSSRRGSVTNSSVQHGIIKISSTDTNNVSEFMRFNSPLPSIVDENPLDDIPDDDPDLIVMIPPLKHALQTFQAELSSEESLRKFFSLVDIDGDGRVSKSEFTITFSYIGFSLTRNRNTGHIEGFILHKIYEAASEGNLEKLSFLHQLSDSSPREMGACLIHAVRNNQFEVAQYLIEKNADVTYQDDRDKRTALHVAAERDNVALMEIILTGKPVPNVNALSKSGNTPLHDACSKVALEAAKLLISVGADINAVNNEGRTPLDMLQLHEEKLANYSSARHSLRLQFQTELRELLTGQGAVAMKHRPSLVNVFPEIKE